MRPLNPQRSILLCTTLLAVGLLASRAHGQAVAEPDAAPPAKSTPAYLIRVPLPLIGSADDRIRRVVTKLIDDLRPGDDRPTLVFEFAGAAEQRAPSGFDRCFALARFLASDKLSAVRTVAFVPQTLIGHDVLPVIACEQIIVADDAEFGAAGQGEDRIGATMRSAYVEIADARRTVPSAAARAMLDASTVLVEADTADGTQLVLESDLAELERTSAVKSVKTIAPAGEMARFTGRQMRRELGLASHLASNHAELAAALERSLEYVNTSQMLGDGGLAIRIDFVGQPTHQSVNRSIRLIADAAIRGTVSKVVVWIDSTGGEPAESVRLAQYLSELNPEQIQVIAYVPNVANADAALVALACDQIVLGTEARLGGVGQRELSAGEKQSLREPIKALAADRAMNWSLPLALVDNDLEVAVYRRIDAADRQVFSEEELAEQPEGRWELAAPLDLGEGLTANRAIDLSTVDEVVASDEEFLLLHGLPTDLEAAELGWADVLIDALARDELAFLLIFIAFGTLWAEVAVPGIGLPGFISAVCFALFFWSRFLHGTAEWLEVILFVLGAVFVIVELFVIPGWGIFGVGGGLMMLAAVILASQTFVLPTSQYQLEQVPETLLMLITCMAGMGVGIGVMRKLLPHTPGLNKVILSPPEGEELAQIKARETVVDWSRFLGQAGITTTRLIPAGKVRIGRETIDCMSRGEMIQSGQPVKVVEAVGNRVIVEPV